MPGIGWTIISHEPAPMEWSDDRQRTSGKAKNDDKLHCDVLAAHWQSMNLGFVGFLKVLRAFRELRGGRIAPAKIKNKRDFLFK